MSRKQFRPYFLAAVTTVAIVLHHAAQPPSASAGGFDDPAMTDMESLMMNGKTEKGQLPLNFDWQRWSQPYALGGQMCREYQGNVVCFTPQVAQQMGWSLPQTVAKTSQKVSPNLNKSVGRT